MRLQAFGLTLSGVGVLLVGWFLIGQLEGLPVPEADRPLAGLTRVPPGLLLAPAALAIVAAVLSLIWPGRRLRWAWLLLGGLGLVITALLLIGSFLARVGPLYDPEQVVLEPTTMQPALAAQPSRAASLC